MGASKSTSTIKPISYPASTLIINKFDQELLDTDHPAK
jgi:hypothetical protein